MKAASIVVVAAVAAGWLACGEPTPLPCSDDVTCGDGKCIGGFCAGTDLTCASGFRYYESAGSLAGQCTGSGASLEPVDVAHELHEGENPIAAVDAKDNVESPCAPVGARDVRFKLHLATERRLYLDTYKTSYPVMLAIYATSCDSLAAASLRYCNTGTTCDPKTRQWSEILAPGDYCIVAEQADLQQRPASLVVRARLGVPVVAAAMPVDVASSCTSNEIAPTCNSPSGAEGALFYMTCGGHYSLDACMTDTVDCQYFNGVLAVYGLSPLPLACASILPPQPAIDLLVTEPAPMWLVADSPAGAACHSLSITVQPL